MNTQKNHPNMKNKENLPAKHVVKIIPCHNVLRKCAMISIRGEKTDSNDAVQFLGYIINPAPDCQYSGIGNKIVYTLMS